MENLDGGDQPQKPEPADIRPPANGPDGALPPEAQQDGPAKSPPEDYSTAPWEDNDPTEPRIVAASPEEDGPIEDQPTGPPADKSALADQDTQLFNEAGESLYLGANAQTGPLGPDSPEGAAEEQLSKEVDRELDKRIIEGKRTQPL